MLFFNSVGFFFVLLMQGGGGHKQNLVLREFYKRLNRLHSTKIPFTSSSLLLNCSLLLQIFLFGMFFKFSVGFRSAEQAEHFIKRLSMKSIFMQICNCFVTYKNNLSESAWLRCCLKKLYVYLSSHLNTIWNLPFTNLFTTYNQTIKYYTATHYWWLNI